jgi:phosphopantothenoylcysteine synthetase/decarboxylase
MNTAEGRKKEIEGAISKLETTLAEQGRQHTQVVTAQDEVLSALKKKIKKAEEVLTLELVRTRDILGSARLEFSYKGVLVGFAAETEDVVENARMKLLKKGCDLVVANDVSKAGFGFDSDRNEVVLVFPDRVEALPPGDKIQLADQVAMEILRISNSG